MNSQRVQRRALLMPAGVLLEKPAEREQPILPALCGHELQPDRQSRSIDAAGHCHGRVARRAEREVEAPISGLSLSLWGRRCGRGRRERRYAVEQLRKRSRFHPANPLAIDVVGGGDGRAFLDQDQQAWRKLATPFSQSLTMERRHFRVHHHNARRRQRLKSVRQIYLNDASTGLRQCFQRTIECFGGRSIGWFKAAVGNADD